MVSMILNFEHNFCELVERIQNIQTDASKNKLSDEAPLGEFVKSEEVKSLQVVVYNKFETASEIQSQITNHNAKNFATSDSRYPQMSAHKCLCPQMGTDSCVFRANSTHRQIPKP